MKRLPLVLLSVLVGGSVLLAQTRTTKPLDIYVVDTEGGKAALWVAPSGESVLIDTGSPGDRDLSRILEAATAAGVTKIDYLISTHYHVDHVGGLQELVKRIPVATFVDHGPTVEGPNVPNLREQVQGFQAAYAELYAKAKHVVVKPGDRIPVTGVDWRIVTSAGQVLKTPVKDAPGAGRPNPACLDTPPKEITTDPENGQSVGSVITFGQFRAADFGDLLWNKEVELMCPSNPLGTVDLFLVTHHGLNQSNSPALVRGLRPRAAVMQNGTGKGAAIDVMQVLRSSPALEDIWQLHWSYTAGVEHNAPGVFIANLEDPATLAGRLTAPPRGGGGRAGGGPVASGAAPVPPGASAQSAAPAAPGSAPAAPTVAGAAPPAPAGAAPAPPAAADAQAPAAAPARQGAAGGGRGGFGGGGQSHSPAYWIKISAQSDGTFTITNSRNSFSKTYTKR
jgi:competence protein ComEC